MDFLRPFSKVSEVNTATVLIVGSEGTGKHTLAKALVSIHTDFSLQVRTAKSLPLPTDNDDGRPEIDFIVFMIDMTNKLSMKTVEESAVTKVDPRYFIGKTCFAVTGNDKINENIINVDVVSQLASDYNSVMIYDSLDTEEGRMGMARKILHLVETAAGFHHGVSPLLAQCTQRPPRQWSEM